MALDDLRQLFEGAKRSVFRLETLPVYEVGEDIERQRAFAAEGRLPPPSPDRVAFIRRMQERTRRVAWSRVHVVDQPLTPYLRHELAAYAENEQGGEQVWIAERAAHPGLADLTGDFVLVDDEAGVWFRYDERGRLVGYERVAPAAVETGVEWLLVEQDETDGPSLEAARRSLAALRTMLGVAA